MKQMTKIALIGASVLSMGALTACQSTAAPKESDHGRMMKQHHGDQKHKMSPEQREQMKQMRAERQQVMQQIKQACDSKAAGSAVQIKAGDKTIDGTCVMNFKADQKNRADRKPMNNEHRPMRGGMQGPMHMQRGGQPMTDAERAELTKQFDQRLAERQAKQQAILKACQGKTDGSAVAIKVGEQQINGKCEVRFQPKAPAAPAPAPVK